jgi:hypothetical protein
MNWKPYFEANPIYCYNGKKFKRSRQDHHPLLCQAPRDVTGVVQTTQILHLAIFGHCVKSLMHGEINVVANVITHG